MTRGIVSGVLVYYNEGVMNQLPISLSRWIVVPIGRYPIRVQKGPKLVNPGLVTDNKMVSVMLTIQTEF